MTDFLGDLARVNEDMDTLPEDDRKRKRIAVNLHGRLQCINSEWEALPDDNPSKDEIRAEIHRTTRRLLKDAFHVDPDNLMTEER